MAILCASSAKAACSTAHGAKLFKTPQERGTISLAPLCSVPLRLSEKTYRGKHVGKAAAQRDKRAKKHRKAEKTLSLSLLQKKRFLLRKV